MAVLRMGFPASQHAALEQYQQTIATVAQRATEHALRSATSGQPHQLLTIALKVRGDDVNLLVFGPNRQARHPK